MLLHLLRLWMPFLFPFLTLKCGAGTDSVSSVSLVCLPTRVQSERPQERLMGKVLNVSHASRAALPVCTSLRLIASVPKLLVSSCTTHATPMAAGGCVMLSSGFKLGETAVSFPL